MGGERAPAAAAAAASYSALPVRLAPGSAQLRYLFVRAHRGERGAGDAAADDASDRTLFVAAVPSWCASRRAVAPCACACIHR